MIELPIGSCQSSPCGACQCVMTRRIRFVNKVRERRFRELALFNSRIHRAGAKAAVEPGFIDESRKSAAAD
jgi:hypothetical protein